MALPSSLIPAFARRASFTKDPVIRSHQAEHGFGRAFAWSRNYYVVFSSTTLGAAKRDWCGFEEFGGAVKGPSPLVQTGRST